MYIEYPYLTPLMVSGSEFITSDIVYNDAATQSIDFNLSTEQDDKDICDIRHAIKIEHGYFNPDADLKNKDDTYSGLIYSQIKNSFYNKNNFQNNIGLNHIDVTIGKSNRKLYNSAKVISIPQIYYGDSIKEKSLEIYEYSGEQVYKLVDDGNGNIVASDKIFPTILQDQTSVVAFNSSSYIDITTSGISVDGSVDNQIKWTYFHPQYLFFNRNDIKKTKLTHDILGETPPYYYNSNLCYVGTNRTGPINNLHIIPSQSNSLSSSLLGNFKKIECGDDFVMVLDDDGEVKIWGSRSLNMYGEHYHILKESYTTDYRFNQTTTSSSYVVDNLEFDSKVIDISAGANHAVLLTEGGRLYLWADNNSSLYNICVDSWSRSGSYVPALMYSGLKSIAASDSGIAAVTNDGRIVTFGESSFLSQSNWPTGSNYKKVSIGYAHGLSLDVDGNVYGWGDNTYGQTEIPTGVRSGIVDISCGDNHNLALNAIGEVFAWGNNNHGQSHIPYGTVIENWGLDLSSPIEVKSTTRGMSGITSISAKYDRSSVIRNDGNNVLVSWGYEGLMTRHNIREYAMGKDFTIIDLDNDYQYVVYYPVYTYSPKSSVVYDNGMVSHTKDITILKTDKYHTFNTFVKKPVLIEKSNSSYLNRYIFNFTRNSLIDSDSREFITLSINSIIQKLGLSNLQNNLFYTQTISSVMLFIEEKSGERVNCLPVRDFSLFVTDYAQLEVGGEVYFYNYIVEGSLLMYLFVENTFVPYMADWGSDYPFTTPPAIGEAPLLIMDTTYENYPLNFIFSDNLIEIQNQENIINVY